MATRERQPKVTAEEHARRVEVENRLRDFSGMLDFDLLRMIANDPVLMAAIAARAQQEKTNVRILRYGSDVEALKAQLEMLADDLNQQLHEKPDEG